MASAEGTGDPQYVVPIRLGRAEARWLEGDRAAAHREASLAEQAADGAGPWLKRGEAGSLGAPYRLARFVPGAARRAR